MLKLNVTDLEAVRAAVELVNEHAAEDLRGKSGCVAQETVVRLMEDVVESLEYVLNEPYLTVIDRIKHAMAEDEEDES